MATSDVLAPTEPQQDSAAFHAVLVVEGVRTTDNREFAPNSLTWRTLPLPLMWQQELSDGHKGAVVVGKITRIERMDNGEIEGWGTFDLGSENGKEARRLVAEQIIRGISIDAELMEIDKEMLLAEGDKAVLRVIEGRIGAATLVSFPAFPQAVIALADAEIPPADSNGRAEARQHPDGEEICRQECGDDPECFRRCMEKKNQMSMAPERFAVSDKSWDSSSSRFTDEQYRRATAGCRGTDAPVKSDCFLPHHEPEGPINRRGIHAAAARFNQVQAPSAAKSRARRHLAAHYRNDLSEPIPDILTVMALVAHAEKPGPPSDWFDPPSLKGPTPLTVARNGRVYGHAALFDSCHLGYKECMKPPRSRTNYAHFLIGEVFASGCDCEDGIPTGPITLGTSHADLYATPSAARSHYDNTGLAVADVNVGEDEFGIWVAGALRPGVTDSQIRALRGSALSGDWRHIGGGLELVGLLAVNVPGFGIPRVAAGLEAGVQTSLVAAGIGEDEVTPIDGEDDDSADLADKIKALKAEKLGEGNGDDATEHPVDDGSVDDEPEPDGSE